MFDDLRFRLRSLFRRKAVEGELDEELRFHLEHETEKYIRSGMTPEEAARRARIELGGIEQTKEEHRDARGIRFLEETWRDIAYAARMLRKSPGFTIVAILTLALGIGANTAIFSVVNSVLLQPLPIYHPSRVVVFQENFPKIKLLSNSVSPPDYHSISQDTDIFESTAAFFEGNLDLTGSGQAQRLPAMHASATFLPLLGIHPILGREFSAAEDTYGQGHVVLLSEGLWKSAFGASHSAIGKRIQLNGASYQVIGVLPSSFQIVYPHVQLLVPLALPPKEFSNAYEGRLILSMLARLRPGITLKQARAAMAIHAARLLASVPPQIRPAIAGFAIEVVPFMRHEVGGVSRPLYLLLGAVLLVLLIACANIANLLLARASTRSREMAVRTAIGADRRRIIAQLLTESILLSLAGGTVGLLFARLGVAALVHFGPANLPHPETIRLDSTVLAFTFLVSVFAGIFFGLAPAIESSKVNLTESIKESSRSGSSLGRSRFRRALVLSEIALTFVLLVGAGLLLRSFAKLLDVNLGFNPGNLLTMSISPSREVGPSDTGWQQRYAAFSRTLLRRVSAIPGVTHAALSDGPPLTGIPNSIFMVRDYHAPANGPQPHADNVATSPAYFATMGIPLLYGRIYTDQDIQTNNRVVIVDQALADRFWPRRSALGKQIGFGGKGPWFSVIGVVGTVRSHTLTRATRGTLYFPAYDPGMSLVVRTAADPTALAGPIRSQIEKLDPTQAVYSVETMGERVSESVAQQRFAAALLALFAALAVALAGVGLYSVMAYLIAQRTREIGIRMALGAQKSDVLRQFVGQGFKLAVTGVGIGIIGALGLTQLLSSMLYGVTPTDPLAFAAASFVLIAVALLACYIPAWRATRLDPMIVLRQD